MKFGVSPNRVALELAAKQASDEDIAALRGAAEQTANSADVAASADALRKFFVTLSAISHNPLLAAVCKAITEIQVGIAVELSGGRSGDFGRVSGALFDARIDIVDAIASRDSHAAADRVREYHRRVIERTRTLPRAKQLRATDPGLAGLLSNWLAANVRLDNAPGGH